MKVVKFLSILLLVWGTAMCQASQSQLISYYSFNDSASLANDDSGNGYSLSLYDVAPDFVSNGSVEGCADFDGTTQGYLASADLYPAGSFTFSAWVKSTADGSSMIVRSFNNGKGFAVLMSPDYRFFTYDSTSKYYYVRSYINPEVDTWQHVVMTFEALSGPDANGDYTGTIKAYINGQLCGTTEDAKYCPDGAGYMCVARRSTAGIYGMIDELAVFNGVLDSVERGALLGKKATPNDVIGYVPTPEVEAYYSFDDSANLSYDDSESGLTLVDYDVAPDYVSSGAVGGGAEFDGVSKGYLAPESIYQAGSFTFSTWVKATADGSDMVTRSYNSGKGFAVLISPDYRFFTYDSTGSYYYVRSYINPEVNGWQHLAMTFEAQGEPDANGDYTGTIKAYINGILCGTTENAKCYPLNAVNMCIGRRATSGFYGLIDEFSVFSGVLNSVEIGALAGKDSKPGNVVGYVPDPDVELYYSFDDSANLANDDSGNGNTLVDYDVAPDYIEDGAVEAAAAFESATQGYLAPADAYQAGSFTFSTWVKATADGSTMVTRSYNSGKGFAVLLAPDFRFFTYDSTGSYYYVRSFVNAEINSWRHIAMTFEAKSGPDVNGDYTGTIKAYIHGKLCGTTENAKYYPANATNMCIGRRATAFFDGLIDEFAVFSGVLNEKEITALARKQRTPLDVFGYETETCFTPIAYYNFDDPNDTSFGIDYSDNGHNLSWVVKPEFEAGPLGAEKSKWAAKFTGTSGQAFKAQGMNIPVADGAFTVALWSKANALGANEVKTLVRSSNNGFAVSLNAGDEYTAWTFAPGLYDYVRTYMYADDSWTHTAVTFEPASYDQEALVYTGTGTIYINGLKIAENDSMRYSVDDIYLFCVGARNDSGLAPFEGAMDDVAIWDTALSQEQIGGLVKGDYSPLEVPARIGIKADLNGDGSVDLADFAMFSVNWLESSY